MTETFVPLTTTTGSSMGGETFQLKVLAQAESKPVFTALTGGGSGNAAPPACERPVLTLQRQGDLVSGIRVECSCGQVIDLKCVY